MDEISLDHGVDIARSAMNADRLAVLCGAGLSMERPSNIPSAGTLAAKVGERYATDYGNDRVRLPTDLGAQAEYFFDRGELETVFLRRYIDFDSFAAPPNRGHYALADLTLTLNVQVVVTTNVDSLVESAGLNLYGTVAAGVETAALAALPPDRPPLLKIHGCWNRDHRETLWANGQLHIEPFRSRIPQSAQWLQNRLMDRDLLVIGYCTDWDYLNGVLESALGLVRTARVILVDPGASDSLARKAPELMAVGRRASVGFFHVQASGAHFLDELRRKFSQAFIRRVLRDGADSYHLSKGAAPDGEWLEPPVLESQEYWQVRRDLMGCLPNEPARAKNPPLDEQMGSTLLQLRARGAVPEGMFWILGPHRIRVVRGAGRMLHNIEITYADAMPPVVSPTLAIAVGAESMALPANVVRPTGVATIARGSACRWVDRPTALTELGL